MHLLKSEKESLLKTQKDYELKLKEIEHLRTKLEKDHIEEIERFKSNLQRSMKDQDFDLHRRRLALEEDEQRVKYEKDRIAMIENKNNYMVKELTETQEQLKKITTDFNYLTKENSEMKE